MPQASIRAAFAQARAEGRAAFVPYVMAGYPDHATSLAVARAMAAAGADVIELGVPFSDPLADGATIQHASQRALEAGATLASSCALAADVTAGTGVPVALMGYYNPFLRMGLDAACALAAAAGVGGLIVPDLPADESGPLLAAALPRDIHPIYLVTPTSSDHRLAIVAAAARAADSGFVYAVSLSGVTGARSDLPPELPAFIARVREHTGDLPVGVGFGIARPDHAAAVAQFSDGIIVASALINAFDHATGDPVAAMADLARALRAAAARG